MCPTFDSLFEFVQAELSGFNFKDKLVAHTYDGAAVMASHLSGVQAKVREGVPPHIALNLVLSQGVKAIPKAGGPVQQGSSFTRGIQVRSDLLELLFPSSEYGCF